jgi:hypothetical protein
MEKEMKKLPIGLQTFNKLRKDNAVYVDKTEEIYNLMKNRSVYFLSRPRRFGKSLLISTLKELFKGSKELFEGLYVYDKWDWTKTSPVIHLDFAEITYSTSEELKFSLNKFIELRAQEEELENNFNEYIKLTAKNLNVDNNKMIEMIKKWYNGYSWDGKVFVYNPFSTLVFLITKSLKIIVLKQERQHF